MKRVQQGFTLIELLIVVAIIGILAALAIPAYQDYVIKSKISEAYAQLDEKKLQGAEYHHTQGTFIGFSPAGGATTYSEAPTTAALSATNATIVVGLQGINATVDAQEVCLVTTDGGVNWTCGKTAGLSANYVPKNCTAVCP